ncbi:P2Y purinoceptor 6-like [Megalobrama amblycephala]|uniref:P2Y purinoceptor 6-like n=1 Tax=Megalobrama amblycephala TaxID=75352 RepID=UPI00201465BC|nr:P2Y purinoceptor 6-like [Megalobrama amblycephala]
MKPIQSTVISAVMQTIFTCFFLSLWISAMKKTIPMFACHWNSLTLVLGLPTNVALLWLLVRGEKALSPSEVLGLNLAVLNILYCVSLPLDVYISLSRRTGTLLPVSEAISILNVIGCPLLLTSMCVERYLAATHAVLYMKLGSRWEYRVVWSGLIWILTLGIAVITYQERLPKLTLYISITLDGFLLIMLACLIGIVRVLRKKGPGEGQTGGRGGSPIKNRALKNALLILIPTAVIYAPLLAIAPYILTLKVGDEASDSQCMILNLFHTFPSLGACIGPVFYMSRAKQLHCCKKNTEKTTMQELQHPK